MGAFDFKINEEDNTYRVELELFDDTIRETFMRLARRQEEVLEEALKALGWMAPEDVERHDAEVAARALREAGDAATFDLDVEDVNAVIRWLDMRASRIARQHTVD